jgi:hypothetical protein
MINQKMTSVLSQNQFFAIGSCFYDPQKGIFAVFFLGKLTLNFQSIFEGIFSIKSKNYFFQSPMQNLSLNGQAVFKM